MWQENNQCVLLGRQHNTQISKYLIWLLHDCVEGLYFGDMVKDVWAKYPNASLQKIMDNIWNSGRDNTKIMIGIDNSGFNFGKGKEIFFFSKASRLSLAPNGPPIQRIPRVFSWNWRGGDLKLKHSHLPPMSRLRISEGTRLLRRKRWRSWLRHSATSGFDFRWCHWNYSLT